MGLRQRVARLRRRPGSGGSGYNLLLVMADQHRWDALGCAGGWVETPNVDRLAAEGVRFANAYTSSPAGLPARLALVTGRYPHNLGVWQQKKNYSMPPEQPTWMRAVQGAGYATGVFGTTYLHRHVGDLRDREHLMHSYGFDHVDEVAGPYASADCRSNLTDRWQEAGVLGAYRRDVEAREAATPWVARPSPLPLELYPDVYVGRQAAAWLRSRDGDAPWLCWVGFPGPREPWDAPEPYASRYDPARMPAPATPAGGSHERPRGVLDERLAREAPAFEEGDVAALRASYAGSVSLIDDQIGELLAAVEERGELDRTVVAFTSDHGELNGDHGLLGGDCFLDGCVRIPLVVRLPPDARGDAEGAVSDAPVELMDLGATFVGLVGKTPRPRSHARSLMPLLADPVAAHRDAALSEVRGETMVATPEWKLALNRRGEPYLLFDLHDDPSETRNLAGLPEHREVEQELHRRLEAMVEATP